MDEKQPESHDDQPLWKPPEISPEDQCGAVHPTLGFACRLSAGHSDNLHAARGISWTSDSVISKMSSLPQNLVIEAIDRNTQALTALKDVVAHYVEEMLHRVRP